MQNSEEKFEKFQRALTNTCSVCEGPISKSGRRWADVTTCAECESAKVFDFLAARISQEIDKGILEALKAKHAKP